MAASFLSLPPEIRNLIYGNLFRDVVINLSCEHPKACTRPVLVRPTKDEVAARHQILSITLVSKRVRGEAMMAFLANAVFEMVSFHTARRCRGPFDLRKNPPGCTEEYFLERLSRIQRVRASDTETTYFDVAGLPVGFRRHQDSQLLSSVDLKELIFRPTTVWVWSEGNADFRLHSIIKGDARQFKRLASDGKWLRIILVLNLAYYDLYYPAPEKAANFISTSRLSIMNGFVEVLSMPQDFKAMALTKQFLEEAGLDSHVVNHQPRHVA